MKARILVVDDEQLIRWFLKEGLTERGYDVAVAETGEEGMALIEKEPPDLLLLDLKLPGIGGLEMLRKIRPHHPELGVIVITAHGEVNSAVEAMKLGSHDFIAKPFKLEEMALVVEKALETMRLRSEVAVYRNRESRLYRPEQLIGKSPRIQEVLSLVEKVAQRDATTVLIQGESGTGKDLMARVLHYHSLRSTGPFMEIDCTSLPPTLFESELFGHEKGAFTDAKASKKGLIETAEGGSVLLNEIADIPLQVQAKLLRVIEQKMFYRIGGTKPIQVDVRIIACTNRDLQTEVAGGRFREDLYYRLKVFPIHLPPLRERPDDIPELVEMFVEQIAREFRRPKPTPATESMELLCRYPWPGNVRELKNVIERAMILADGNTILPTHLPAEVRGAGKPTGTQVKGLFLPDEGVVLDDVEKELIRQALEKSGGNQSQAARLLGLTRDTLRYRMEKYGLN